MIGGSVRSSAASSPFSVDPAALVAAYGFDEGSGTAVADSSGKGNGGTIAGAAWDPAGKFGGALSFDGANDLVTVPDADSLDLTTGMTVGAWVKPAALGAWRSIVVKEAGTTLAYGLYGSTTDSTPAAEMAIGTTLAKALGTQPLPLAAWNHVSMTYDGAQLRLYVNGILARSKSITGAMSPSTAPLRIGGNGVWPEFFQGEIDEVKIYNRPLSPAEILEDMTLPVGSPDETPPTAPGQLAASGSAIAINLTWQASTDDNAVTRYNVHRSTNAGFTPSAANRIAQPTGTSYNDAGLAAGTYYYKVTAEDARGNVSPASNESSASVTGDAAAPTAPGNLSATPGGGSASLAWSAASDNVGVTRYNVHRSTSAGFTPTAANRVAQPTGTSYVDGGLPSGTYYYRVTAEDASGNVGPASNQATAAVSSAPVNGLVAAYGFEENEGTDVADSSGHSNDGTISGASWTTTGRYGAALSFDGGNDFVTVPDDASLDLTTTLTLEAWVKPSANTGWRSVIMKEQPTSLIYALYASSNVNRPNGSVHLNGVRNAIGTSQLPANDWTHLAMSFGGGTIRLYVNGALNASSPRTGSVPVSDSPLRIGGNGVWPEWFSGQIDEVRVYNRVLSPAEIATDMATPVGGVDRTPPSTPTDFSVSGSTNTSITTSWSRSTDNVGVSGYRLYRDGVEVATTTDTTHAFTGLACGTAYDLAVEAFDADDNTSPRALLATSTQACDTTPPNAPADLVAAGSLSEVDLTWSEAHDPDGVVTHYNLHRSTTSGFTPSLANRIAQPTGTSYTDAARPPGTYYYVVTAEDAAANVSAPSNQASAVVTGDSVAPTAPGNLTATGSIDSVAVSWTASTDNVGVVRYNLHRSTTAGFTPSAANRIAQPTGTSYTDAGRPPGTYYYRVTAEDAVANVSAPSDEDDAVVTGDITAPSVPSGVTAAGSVSSVALNWNDSTDDVGVHHYNVHRSTSASFTPSAANRIAEPTSSDYTDAGLVPGTYHYRVTAEDAAGNVSVATTSVSGVVTGDITAPSVPGNFAATGSVGAVSLTWSAATDDVGVRRYNVHRSATSSFTPTLLNRIAQPTGTSYVDPGLEPGTYHYQVTAEDDAGNIGPASAERSATVSATTPGLVASYSFSEGQGTTLTDVSGNGNSGTISGAAWTTAGKFDSALTFDGVNDWVTIPDSASLDLTSGMTLEAWVRPTAVTAWRTVVMKEQPSNLVYALYANTNTNRPSGNVWVGSPRDVRGTAQLPANAWTHLAATYDGAAIKIYVNGALAGTSARFGTILTSAGVLRIGGNAVWSEWFQGQIDEVRVYNRALSEGEIQVDMATSVGTPDTTPPSAPSNFTATGGTGSVSLAWSAAQDNVGIQRYDVHRSTSPGFTPDASNRIAQPAGTSYTDAGRPAGTYYYRVIAFDHAGNAGPASLERSATVVGDTTPPTVSITAPASGATVFNTITVAANASDASGVSGVQFKLDGQDLGAEDTTPPFSTSWATRASSNGSHTLTAVARDPSGNVSTSAAVPVTVDNTSAPPPGLVAGYGFEEKTGTTVNDSSGNANTGTISGATWTAIGHYGSALSFDGVDDQITVADSSSLDLSGAATLSAWVKPASLTAWRTILFKERVGGHVYALYANASGDTPRGEADIAGGAIDFVPGTGPLPANTWSYLAMTYDGGTMRLYVDGTLVGTKPASGPIVSSTGVLRIGANAIWGERFSGLIDEVRVYDRALSQGEVQADMAVGVLPDTRAPQVSAVIPASGASDVSVTARVTVTFDEAMNPVSITSTTINLKDSLGATVPATVTYDGVTGKATLVPNDALKVGTTYTARVEGGTSGPRVTDFAGNAPVADFVWSFTTESNPPPILVLTSSAPGQGFTKYVPELLRAEGLNEFTTADASLMSPGLLNLFDVVLLGEMPLTSTQVSQLSSWVTAGGNLVAFRPDKQLAGLLGLTDLGTTITNGYLLVNTLAPPGNGIVGQTIQYHGTADRYTPSGASTVATLYTTESASTTSPAVTLRNVGGSGGQAAAFTFDLARSIALTRQGNPAWAGQDRDGINPIRPNDLFYGARTGDLQPDWVNTGKIGIPQADEQQRLLANLITHMARDRKPLPRFWYLPRGEKAAIVMTGDDHDEGGTPGHFDRFKEVSPAGCSVALWECVRATSYVYVNNPVLTDAMAAGYIADGFEVALHTRITGGCGNWTPANLTTIMANQRALFAAAYPSAPPPVSERTHCVAWSDWVSHAEINDQYGIRLDTNYYHYPASWIGDKPGYMTGSALPMRFADDDGTPIDVFQAHTHMTDEGGQVYPFTVDTLLDKALGPQGYYGVLTTNMHTDKWPHAGANSIIASALARDVPIISAKQLLAWVDGRDSSSFKGFAWSGGNLDFTVTVGAGATGLQVMLPTSSPAGTLSAITKGGTPVSFTTQTIKGVSYAFFTASPGAFRATYS